MFFMIQIILLFSIFLFASSYVFVGNYSQLNPKDCGISRVSTLVDTNCFEWHKGYDSNLKTGRLVGHSDAPWVVLLDITKQSGSESYCTGSIIADNWVITAAHCLKNATNVKIYSGYNFTRGHTNKVPFDESKEVYIHPKYSKLYDLGLIKMNKPINTSLGVNSICLPNKYFEDPIFGTGVDPGYEYAMVAGWGPNRNKPESEHRLRITETRILIKSYKENTVEVYKLNNQGTCKGDSGSGVWQYYMGRAVITSVIVSAPGESLTNCEFDNDNRPAEATWVDSQIDWIQNVTQLN